MLVLVAAWLRVSLRAAVAARARLTLPGPVAAVLLVWLLLVGLLLVWLTVRVAVLAVLRRRIAVLAVLRRVSLLSLTGVAAVRPVAIAAVRGRVGLVVRVTP